MRRLTFVNFAAASPPGWIARMRLGRCARKWNYTANCASANCARPGLQTGKRETRRGASLATRHFIKLRFQTYGGGPCGRISFKASNIARPAKMPTSIARNLGCATDSDATCSIVRACVTPQVPVIASDRGLHCRHNGGWIEDDRTNPAATYQGSARRRSPRCLPSRRARRLFLPDHTTISRTTGIGPVGPIDWTLTRAPTGSRTLM